MGVSRRIEKFLRTRSDRRGVEVGAVLTDTETLPEILADSTQTFSVHIVTVRLSCLGKCLSVSFSCSYRLNSETQRTHRYGSFPRAWLVTRCNGEGATANFKVIFNF